MVERVLVEVPIHSERFLICRKVIRDFIWSCLTLSYSVIDVHSCLAQSEPSLEYCRVMIGHLYGLFGTSLCMQIYRAVRMLIVGKKLMTYIVMLNIRGQGHVSIFHASIVYAEIRR